MAQGGTPPAPGTNSLWSRKRTTGSVAPFSRMGTLLLNADILIKRKFGWVSELSQVGVLLLVIASCVVAAAAYFGLSPPKWVELMAAVCLGGVLLIGLFLMVFCTFIVVRERRLVTNLGQFLALTWLIPYIGIIGLLAFAKAAQVSASGQD